MLFISTMLFNSAITEVRTLKLEREIEHISQKEYSGELCMQYALIVSIEGWFSSYKCADEKLYIYIGKVWKYVKTCSDLSGRYPKGLPLPFLTFQPQFYGTKKECLIMEKLKIQAYPTLQECWKREIKLLRPPGNKIDR
jgi:hypothetical protein